MTHRLPQSVADSLSLPVIAAPMFLVSGPDLVMESCKSGVIGAFPTLNARTAEILEAWLQQITRTLETVRKEEPSRRVAPWAVNLIVHRSNARFEDDLKLLIQYKAPIVITSLGNPSAVVEEVHRYGGLVFSDVISLTHAKKAAESGVDGLILVCAGAGGHAGTRNPFAFTGAVREFWDGILVVAGGITSGRDVLAVQAMGADLAYMGTRFIATHESMASEEYKQMLIESTMDDLIYTDAFSGVHANYLVPSIRRAGLDPASLQKKESVDFSHLQTGVKAWKDIWSAGQGVNQIKQVQSVAGLVETLRREYDAALESLMKMRAARV
jgi:nitronate monooxygenase